MVTSQAFIITVPAQAAGGDSGIQQSPAMIEPTVSNRKRRLAHLTLEEKQYRKKLKNRVAAQTSRDRKKQRMDELESSIVLMSQELEAMTKQNATLATENALLKQQLHDAQMTTTALLETLQSEKCSCGKSPKGNAQATPAELPSVSSRPAESTRHPLLKGLDGKQVDSLSVLRILLMTFLLSRSSLQTWDLVKISQTLETWSDLRKASSKKPLPVKRISQAWNQWWGRHQKSWNPVEEVPA
ncbi:X-box-binding protein 1 [Thrips palmi]|uniref:X-box-binding protein 1 n=1 Tax=Thrips palmi TaxID=161013 RepID=A0A6P8XU35_THRPL|nr:X-box-binding protein 1 [Thrips palmi]